MRLRVPVLVAVVGLLSAYAVSAPLLPPLPTTPSSPGVAGESKLAELRTTPADYIRIDWIVQDATPFGFSGFFAYLYQIENTTGTPEGIRSFNVAFGTSAQTTAGVLDGDNLDLATAFHAAHDALTPSFSNLGPPGPETEPSPGTLNPSSASSYSVAISPTGVSWNINVTGGIPKGNQGITFFIIDPRPPMYGVAAAQDSGKQWATGPTLSPPFGPGVFGDPVPVPSPEPSTLALLTVGVGIYCLTMIRRRYQA